MNARIAAAIAGISVDECLPPSRTIRIAVVTETYPPEVNGVAMTVARLVEGLQARNHPIQLIRPRQHVGDSVSTAPSFDEVLMRGLPVPRYPQLKMGLPSKAALLRLWRQRRPDLVHIATEGPLGWSALRAARQLRLPVCSEFRTNFHEYSRYYGIGWMHRPIAAYLRKFHNATQCTMVPTERLRRTLESERFERVITVSRGVDAAQFSPARRDAELRRQWGAGEQSCVAISVGRLAPEKNLELLIRSHDAIRASGVDLRLVFVGDGPQRAEIARRCPSAIFAGSRFGADLAAHYASADLFAFPSLTETFGNVTLEAMASGLAVLAFDDAAAGQLIRSGENGLLVTPRDEQAFIRQACRLAQDAALRISMGRRARTSAEQLDWPRIVEQLESVMFRVLDGFDHHAPRSTPRGAYPA